MGYFLYGKKETDYLSKKDEQMAAAIKNIPHIMREVDPDIFASIVHQIIGQQISNKALATIWARVNATLGKVSPKNVLDTEVDKIHSLGISYKKASYIIDAAKKFNDNTFDVNAIKNATDDEAIKLLTGLKGVGVWTAQMILLFSLQRPNILSYDDIAIRRGLCLLHNLPAIDKTIFEKYKVLYSPYSSTASLYLWEIATNNVWKPKELLHS